MVGRRTLPCVWSVFPLTTLLLTVGQVACLADPASPTQRQGSALLEARPGDVAEPLPPGKHPLGLDTGRDGFIYVPEGLIPGAAVPLVILLHGATGRADNWEGGFHLADSLGMVLLATDSRAQTWDAIRGPFGQDVSFLDRALERTFQGVPIAPGRIAIGGFSDGASYALSIGLANGELFTHVLAFSPGFIVPAPTQGRPGVFISHGTADPILPIDVTSRRIVPDLQGTGYSVIYEEFEGGHEIPPDIVRQGFAWFLGG